MAGSAVSGLSWSEVRARRLERHGLARPLPGAGPADVVGAVASVHAQVMSAAEVGVMTRTETGTRQDVRDALWKDRTLVKTYGLRGTVHLVPARDLGLWVGALSAMPPVGLVQDPAVRLAPGQIEDVLGAAAEALTDAELTVEELTEEIVSRTGAWAGDLVMEAFQGKWPRWRQVMHLAGMRGALCFAPNKGRKVAFTHPSRWLPGFAPAAPEVAVPWLLRSYLHAYGPSTPQRFAHWLNAPVTWAKDAFAAHRDELQAVEVEGRTEWVAAGDVAAPETPPTGVRLLPYFDGYAYRVGNQPPALLYPGVAAERALRGNFQVLLVDGEVGGLWHQRRSGRKVAVTVEAFGPLTPGQHDDLVRQVDRLGEILEAVPTLTLGEVTVGGHA
ncbi:winged helix DNA-binding domain-containing protein [Actinocorallia sp. A-T 12471]|uniref:winged helix DNA-binding domain-containing protein n=1 Tax=Actinocorallia sp. A-T 12471 TaxID=3089813 RepID=UPI0029CCF2B1|nr:winged helix DNA-binding domain-containing protein [Actinocorallia sp. A-T 12471]MDX6742254.1 winged helix DNA-binding domain-containing protein [Actinocorallia sp. A-T 12471]